MFSAAGFMDAGFISGAMIALIAGALSFLSPCVLPIVPPYLAYMGGVSVKDLNEKRAARGPVMLAALFFVLGLSTVFLFLGFAFSAMGRMFLQYQDVMLVASGVVIMIFGLHFLDILRIPFLQREARLDAGNQGGSAFGAYILGLAFAFGWTPCLGPILGAILSMAASGADMSKGTLMLAFYAIGLGIPFLLVAAFFPALSGVMTAMRKHMGRIERVSGLLLWTVGLMMVTGEFTALSFWLLEKFPALATIG